MLSLIGVGYIYDPNGRQAFRGSKNAESSLNHHLSRFFGVSSLAWTGYLGYLVYVAIPGSREEYIRWNNFLDVLPIPGVRFLLAAGKWNLYAQRLCWLLDCTLMRR
jgi:photosystem I P700 chlorophyll a apoprotein A2